LPLASRPEAQDIDVDMARSGVALADGWRANSWSAFFGVPRGALGSVGARLLPVVARRLYEMMAAELDLQPDDDLLDVGCGSAGFMKDQAARARYVAGLDASDIQVDLARRRLGDRIAAGTAEIVLGDAAALPWEDGRFSVVMSLNCVKFTADPQQALREMHRILRSGGRVVLTLDEAVRNPDKSGTIDVFGQWQWSADDARRMMEEAGFADVSVTQLPASNYKLQLVRGTKPA
jgi:SAM-dependent methyltransferase